MSNNDIWKWSAKETANAVKNKMISATDSIKSSLKRLDEVNSNVNAVVVSLKEEALTKAQQIDKKIKNNETLGSLAGVPITIKENVDVKNQSTTNGMKVFKDIIAPQNSPVVQNLIDEDGIIIGRTNTPEISYRWFTDNPLRGLTKNPWSEDITPGGSSGGAAASVALGIGDIAHGNDVGGSIRYPAYACGVVGIKPGLGCVPAYNPSAIKERGIALQLMSVQGPHAREVEDLRLALKAMSSKGDGDPWWTPLKHSQPITKPINIAVNKWCGNTKCHKDVEASIDTAALIFTNRGFNVVEKTPPEINLAAESWRTIFGIDAKINMLELVKESGSQDIINVVQGFVDAASGKGINEFNEALSARNKVLRSWNDFMNDFPIIISPVSALPPYKQGEDQLGKERFKNILEEQSPLYVINFLGLPSVSVPINIKNNVPSGVQIIAPRYYENLALDMAKILEDEIGVFYKKLWNIL
tara:strand:+ start:949 stop:2361 length:1413 start_codon:yes stop_codon:yes gene_type:complete